MKEGVIGSSWSNKHNVLAVALAPKEPFWKEPGIHQLNAFQCLVAYRHTSEQADLSYAFMRSLRFHTSALVIHLVSTDKMDAHRQGGRLLHRALHHCILPWCLAKCDVPPASGQ
jgi:hypothetical protein